MQTRRSPVWLAAAAGVVAVLAALGAPAAAGDAPVTYPVYAPDTAATVIYLVRHAEKNPHPAGGDSGLSEAGHRRARALAHALQDAGVEACYASRYARTQLTALPLAAALADSVRRYDANDPESLARRLLLEHRGQTVLVVGHSDTVPQTIEALTGLRFGEDESVPYDRIFVAYVRADGSSRLLRLRYGERLE